MSTFTKNDELLRILLGSVLKHLNSTRPQAQRRSIRDFSSCWNPSKTEFFSPGPGLTKGWQLYKIPKPIHCLKIIQTRTRSIAFFGENDTFIHLHIIRMLQCTSAASILTPVCR